MAIYVCRKRGSGNPRVQHKTVDAESSLLVVLADSGYDVLGSVTINPQTHSESYTPQPNTSNNDMGAVHNKRYVNTSGMVVPSGNTNLGTFTSNGTYTNKDVSGKATASLTVNVSNPVLSGNATESDVLSGKTFYSDNYTKKTGTIESISQQVIRPSTQDVVLPGGKYLEGSQTIRGVTAYNINPENIKYNVPITVGDIGDHGRIASATGTFTGSSTVSTGYTAADRPQILSGYSAWVNGAEVKGSYTLAGATGVDQGKNPIDASHVMSGYQGWVNGQKISGSYTPSSMLYDGEGRATPSAKTFSPEDGMEGFLTFRVLPQNHSDIYDTVSGLKPDTLNDMGANHNFRYVDTTGMITPSETLLWTNPSTTSPMPTGTASDAFVTISEEYIHFDYLKISYNRATDVSQISEAILPVAFMGDMYTSKCGLIEKDTDGNTYCRLVHNARVYSYKTIAFSTCNRVVSGQSAIINNAICIPLKIIGIKCT